MRDLLAVGIAHVEVAGHEQRAVLVRQDDRRPRRLLLRCGVKPFVAQGAGRTARNGLGDCVRVGRVHVDPRPPPRIEDLRQPA